jgi:hypothetical protein
MKSAADIDRVALILAAQVKRHLPETKDQAMRLHALQLMRKFFPDEMLQLIGPATDAELQMFCAARKFDSSDHTGELPPSFEALRQSFEHFAQLNPGLQKALDWRATWVAEQDRAHEAAAARSLAEARQGHPHG